MPIVVLKYYIFWATGSCLDEQPSFPGIFMSMGECTTLSLTCQHPMAAWWPMRCRMLYYLLASEQACKSDTDASHAKNTSKGWDWEQLTLSDLDAESSSSLTIKGNTHVQVMCVKYSDDSIQLPSIPTDGREFLAKDTGVSVKQKFTTCLGRFSRKCTISTKSLLRHWGPQWQKVCLPRGQNNDACGGLF